MNSDRKYFLDADDDDEVEGVPDNKIIDAEDAKDVDEEDDEEDEEEDDD